MAWSAAAIFVFPLAAQSWLDAPQPANWNTGELKVSAAPRLQNTAMAARCSEQERRATLPADRRVQAAGWRLFGAAHVFGSVTVVSALADYDGMCRPMQFQAFVFAGDRYAGSIAPQVMNSRTDGALTRLEVTRENQISAEFARYTKDDALCCPSSATRVIYELQQSPGPPRLTPVRAISVK
jgi:hypothetical protein